MKGLIEQIRGNVYVDKLLKEYGGQLKKVAVLGAAVLLVFAVFIVKGGSEAAEIEETKAEQVQAEEYEADEICVDIGGAVMSPMLARLPEGSRVEDAIQAAGGLKEDADMTSINRAQFLEDGEKVYIPAYERDEEGKIISSISGAASAAGVSSGVSAGAETGKSNPGKININTADSASLQTLNGVGPATAEKIIDYRTSNGRFTSIDDIKNVSGIGDKTFEKLKDSITT